MLKIKETAGVVVDSLQENAKLAATITAGNVINARVGKLVSPKLPLMVRGYAGTPLGEAAIANLCAAALIHVMPGNSKVLLAADAMQKAAMIKFAGTFNIEEMIDELLDGVTLETSKEA